MARGVEGRALVVDLDAKRRCVAEGRLEARHRAPVRALIAKIERGTRDNNLLKIHSGATEIRPVMFG
jgi:hypothetical protein